LNFFAHHAALPLRTFAVKGSCCLWKATDFNRKGREGRAASYAKKIKIEPLPKKLNN
jgi:hypothetical protein